MSCSNNVFNVSNKQKSVAVLKGFVFGVNWHKHLNKIQDLCTKIRVLFVFLKII